MKNARVSFLVLVLAALGCGPKSIDARMRDADKLSDKIVTLLDEAERAIGEIQPQKAESALTEAKKLMDEPDMKLSPDREVYVSRHAELLPKLPEIRELRKQKDIEEAVIAERAEIGPSLQAMKDAAEAIAGPKVDEKLIDAARTSVATLEKAVGATDERRVQANRDPSFGGYLKRAKAETEKARAELTRAEKKLKFLQGPVAQKTKAGEELAESRAEKDLEKKRALMTAAVASYGACMSSGAEFTKNGFATEKVSVGGPVMTVDAFLDSCKTAQESTAKAITKLPKPKPAAPAKKAKKK